MTPNQSARISAAIEKMGKGTRLVTEENGRGSGLPASASAR